MKAEAVSLYKPSPYQNRFSVVASSINLMLTLIPRFSSSFFSDPTSPSEEVYQPQNLVLKSPQHDHDGFQLKGFQESSSKTRVSRSSDDHDHGHNHGATQDHNHSDRIGHGVVTPRAEDDVLPDRRFYIKQLFKKYGNENVLTFEGFEHLLANLGLNDFDFDHHIEDHHVKSDFRSIHDKSHQHQRQEG